MRSLLYCKSYKINDYITIRIPTFGEVFDNEEAYYEAVTAIVSTPNDMMVQLDDAGIDFTTVKDFDLFTWLFPKLLECDTSLIFGDLDLSKFKPRVHKITGEVALIDMENERIIDSSIHAQIADLLRKILLLEKNDKKPANEEAKKYMLYRARKKFKRASKKRKNNSSLESYAIALVNCEKFKYDFESIREISIYQFYMSLQEVSHRIKFDNTMIGCYAGTIKTESLSSKDLSWIMNY